jgi:hypothetical protein
MSHWWKGAGDLLTAGVVMAAFYLASAYDPSTTVGSGAGKISVMRVAIVAQRLASWLLGTSVPGCVGGSEKQLAILAHAFVGRIHRVSVIGADADSSGGRRDGIDLVGYL